MKKIVLSKKNDDKLNRLISNGSLLIKDFADKSAINDFSKNLKWIAFDNSVKQISPIIIEKKSIVHKLLTNKFLKDIVVDYLGKDAKLDSVEVQNFSQYKK